MFRFLRVWCRCRSPQRKLACEASRSFCWSFAGLPEDAKPSKLWVWTATDFASRGTWGYPAMNIQHQIYILYTNIQPKHSSDGFSFADSSLFNLCGSPKLSRGCSTPQTKLTGPGVFFWRGENPQGWDRVANVAMGEDDIRSRTWHVSWRPWGVFEKNHQRVFGN